MKTSFLNCRELLYLEFKKSSVASVNWSDRSIFPMHMNEVHLMIKYMVNRVCCGGRLKGFPEVSRFNH